MTTSASLCLPSLSTWMIVSDPSSHTRTCPVSVTWRLCETGPYSQLSAGTDSVEITVPSLDSVTSCLLTWLVTYILAPFGLTAQVPIVVLKAVKLRCCIWKHDIALVAV
ncbi:hypothetical protein DPMN_137926 [Dreissena polymorpha]|uniref:Uncharacterized protein n=1 Tax=Dreissena polymorpha TaxID=45954 RepID=A0A9D4JI42_DREPO|nr:hypothetical protein DPMN_137926 [Dreissena polymorpha]